MRISVNELDPGYFPAAHMFQCTVTCDGDVIENPITIDTDEGYVLYFAMGFGRAITHEVDGERRLLTLERSGHVVMELG